MGYRAKRDRSRPFPSHPSLPPNTTQTSPQSHHRHHPRPRPGRLLHPPRRLRAPLRPDRHGHHPRHAHPGQLPLPPHRRHPTTIKFSTPPPSSPSSSSPHRNRPNPLPSNQKTRVPHPSQSHREGWDEQRSRIRASLHPLTILTITITLLLTPLTASIWNHAPRTHLPAIPLASPRHPRRSL